MLFNSIEFAIFLPFVYLAFSVANPKWRNLILLAASCHFYAAFIPKYLLILFAVILLDYAAALGIEKFRHKKAILLASLVGNLGILAVFKYFNFFIDNLHDLAVAVGWNYSPGHFALVLPIGLSFHTFQSMSYTIEVYRGKQKAEPDFLLYALYVLYFPQLVAGPIERPQNMFPQFKRVWTFDYEQAREGLQLIACGLLKKCVVADTLALMVNQAYGDPASHSGASLLLASIFFSWQIFCDFSGYTDIARGVSRLFGIELMMNFDKPYLAAGFSEFWRRWHISLSTWFRDYVYIPLGGNRAGPWRHSLNLLVVFLVSGFWHGANWTFIVWGAIHWLLLTVEFVSPSIRAPRVLRGIYVFSAVTLAWVFFRASSVAEAGSILDRILRWEPGTLSITQSSHFVFGASAVSLFFFFQVWDAKTHLQSAFGRRSAFFRWAAYASAIFLFVLLGQFSSNQFIYFQF